MKESLLGKWKYSIVTYKNGRKVMETFFSDIKYRLDTPALSPVDSITIDAPICFTLLPEPRLRLKFEGTVSGMCVWGYNHKGERK